MKISKTRLELAMAAMAAERFDELFPLTLAGTAQEIGQRLLQAGLTQNQAQAFMRIIGG